MRGKLVGLTISFALFLPALMVVSQTRTRPAPQRQAAQKPPAGSLKIKYRSVTGGQTMESTTMIKGARERSEMNTGSGMDMISITQCDLKRTIQINERAQKYIITPMQTVEAGQPSPSPTSTGRAEPVRRGGVVTYTTTATDTGERKEMFGFTARHVKTSLAIDSSPDACNPVKQRMETDGWYIDFDAGIDCDLGQARMATRPPVPGGCQDRVQFKRLGNAKTGYPLNETVTMYGPDGRVMFTSTKEVVELSREPLDAALFDVPAGYTEAKDSQELYGMPSMESIMNQANEGREKTEDPGQTTSGETRARAGLVRVGVVTINNKAGKAVSIDSLRERLVGNLKSAGVEAVPLNAISQAEAELEAKAKHCDFILYTNLTSLKGSGGKIGGMFGRATGIEGMGKTEAKIEFKLFATGESSPRLQSTASAKEEGDEASAGTAIDTEARQVSAAVQKRN